MTGNQKITLFSQKDYEKPHKHKNKIAGIESLTSPRKISSPMRLALHAAHLNKILIKLLSSKMIMTYAINE